MSISKDRKVSKSIKEHQRESKRIQGLGNPFLTLFEAIQRPLNSSSPIKKPRTF